MTLYSGSFDNQKNLNAGVASLNWYADVCRLGKAGRGEGLGVRDPRESIGPDMGKEYPGDWGKLPERRAVY